MVYVTGEYNKLKVIVEAKSNEEALDLAEEPKDMMISLGSSYLDSDTRETLQNHARFWFNRLRKISEDKIFN